MSVSKQKEKSAKLRGLAGVVAKQLEPLKTNPIFLKKYSNLHMVVLLNAHDGKYAAMVEFNRGNINIEGYHLIECKSTTLKNGELHVLVGLNEEVVHDPNPKAKAIGEVVDYIVFTPLEPASLVRIAKEMEK